MLLLLGAEMNLLYKNHRGVTQWRRVRILSKKWTGSTKWHLEEQELVDVWDYDKQDRRTFTVKDIMEAKLVS